MGETKRKMLTPEERVAKLEADLAAARLKAESKDRGRHDQLQEQRAKLQAKVDDAQAKIEAIDAELGDIIERVPALAQPTLHAVADSDDVEAAAV